MQIGESKMNAIKKIRISIVSVFVLIIVMSSIFDNSETETTDSTTKNALVIETSTKSDVSEHEKYKSTNEESTIVHDKEYLITRERIWKFLLDKGYNVETILGIPNIRKMDAKLDEGYQNWYAFIEQNGEWIEFSIVLFNGEVTGIQPVKR
jgi:hypothetical protein